MSLRFAYVRFRRPHPVLTLGGRYQRARPIVTVTLIGPAGSVPIDSLLDTAADDTVFSERTAATLGIDLTNAPAGICEGVGSGPVPVRFAEVTLRLADNQEQREWKALVAFTAARLRYPMLGFAGCLQFFTATFRGDLEEVELTVNGLYQGT